jgi:hypothetical protein
MSANADVLGRAETIRPGAMAEALPKIEAARGTQHWNLEDFAREQIRGLVRRVFFGNAVPAVKEVVFCATDNGIEMTSICRWMAVALAEDTPARVALIDSSQSGEDGVRVYGSSSGDRSIESLSEQIAFNLWSVPRSIIDKCEDFGNGRQWVVYLEKLRKEFQYLIIEASAASISSEAALLGQMTDGVILVLGASSSRRASARRIKDTLQAARCRILGTVLAERTFPMPEGIYQRL